MCLVILWDWRLKGKLTKPLWNWSRVPCKSNFTSSSWSILMQSVTSDAWHSFLICLHNTMWSSYLIKVVPEQFFSVILSKILIALFAIKSAYSFSRKIRLLGDFLVDGIFERAGFWILFVESMDISIKEFINRVLFTFKLQFKLVDRYNKWSKAWLPIFSISKSYWNWKLLFSIIIGTISHNSAFIHHTISQSKQKNITLKRNKNTVK